MRTLAYGALFFVCCATLFGQSPAPDSAHPIVPGWFQTGNDPNGLYKISADTAHVHSGKSSLSIKCAACGVAKSPQDATEFETAFGSVAQGIKADAYRNKRVRFSAYMKTEDVNGNGAVLWMRVDGNNGTPLAFDNMSEPDRSVHGTNDWRIYDIVLDIPANASEIVLGALLSGRGQMWVDDATFDVVGNGTPTTGDATKYQQEFNLETSKLTPEQLAEVRKAAQKSSESAKSLPVQPENLGFEQ